ncbi:hypothetical protein QUF76_13675 [Desulfobacterales bacterium HSG16]|nr:hypothetical protein [Desulfobacterales bacterium HSG16]
MITLKDIKLKNIKMKPKLIGMFLIIGLVPLVLVSLWSARLSTNALVKKSFDQLTGSRESKKVQMQQFINDSKIDLEILVDTAESIKKEALEKIEIVSEFGTGILENWVRARMDDTHLLFLTPFYADSVKTILYGTLDEAERVRKKILHEFENNRKIHGYYNEMKILDMEGNHLVSLKGIDKNEADRTWFSGALENAKKTVKRDKCKDLYVSTIEHCDELNLPSIHMAHVIRDWKTFAPIAVFAVDCNVDNLMRVMANRAGLGETGKSYLVGADFIMRSNLTTEDEPTIFKKTIETEGVKDVFADREVSRGKDICKNLTYIGYGGGLYLGITTI